LKGKQKEGLNMGMYDYIHVECELPIEVPCEAKWQTKDTPSQFLDDYYLTAKGRLEYDDYEEEIEYNEEAPFGFYVHRKNVHRTFCEDFTGSIRFYDEIEGKWYEFYAFIENGKVLKIVDKKKKDE
jgi:hypothetical protein